MPTGKRGQQKNREKAERNGGQPRNNVNTILDQFQARKQNGFFLANEISQQAREQNLILELPRDPNQVERILIAAIRPSVQLNEIRKCPSIT